MSCTPDPRKQRCEPCTDRTQVTITPPTAKPKLPLDAVIRALEPQASRLTFEVAASSDGGHGPLPTEPQGNCSGQVEGALAFWRTSSQPRNRTGKCLVVQRLGCFRQRAQDRSKEPWP